MSDIPVSRRIVLSTGLCAVGIALCASFWVGAPSWNREILGRYSVKWFAGAILANALILGVSAAIVRRMWARRRLVSEGPHGMSVARKALFTSITVAPFLAGSEVWLRARYFPPPPHMFRPDSGSAMGFHALLQHVDRALQDGTMVRAYRGKTYEMKKTTRFRIVCLGGSTTWGHQLQREQTWPAILEDRLQSLGHDVEVINAGRPWYTSAHSVVNYALEMRYYNPDIVIVMHGINDLARSFPAPGEPPPEWDYGSYQGPMRNVLAGYRAHNRKHTWRAWNPAHALSSLAVYRLLFEPRPDTTDKAAAEVGLEAFPTLHSFRAHMQYLAQLCLQDKHRVIFATQAHVYDHKGSESPPGRGATMREAYMQTAEGVPISVASLSRAMHAVREITLDLGRSLDIPVADVERTLDGRLRHFMDDFHLNPEGNSAVADTLAAIVHPLLIETEEARLTVNKAPASTAD